MRADTQGLKQDGLIVLNDVDTRQSCHGLYSDARQGSVSEELEDIGVGRDLSLHFVLDLSSHESEFLLCLVRMQVPADFDECRAGLIDLAVADQLTWRMGHERGKTWYRQELLSVQGSRLFLRLETGVSPYPQT